MAATSENRQLAFYSFNTTDFANLSSYNSTAFSSMTKNLSGPDRIFVLRACILLIGLLAITANSLVLMALLSKRLLKYNTNALILNQTIVDLYTGVMIVITNAFKMPNPVYSGKGGDVLCALFGSEMLMWIGLDTSTCCLVFITLERYLKIVHSIWHRKHFQNWMIYAAMVISWVNGICMEISGAITSRVIDGMCIPYAFWLNPSFSLASGYITFIWQFMFTLFIFAFCYGSIFYVVQKQAKVTDAEHGSYHGGNKDAAKKSKSNKTKRNILVTMVIVTFTYFLCWLPNEIYQLLAYVAGSIEFDVTSYYGTLFLALLDVLFNPVIYAAKHDHINCRLREMIGCGIKKKTLNGSVDTKGPSGSGRGNMARDGKGRMIKVAAGAVTGPETMQSSVSYQT